MVKLNGVFYHKEDIIELNTEYDAKTKSKEGKLCRVVVGRRLKYFMNGRRKRT